MNKIDFYITKNPRIGILSFFELVFLLLIITIPISLILWIVEMIVINNCLRKNENHSVLVVGDAGILINYNDMYNKFIGISQINKVKFSRTSSMGLTFGGRRGYGFAQTITNHNFGTLVIITDIEKIKLYFIENGDFAKQIIDTLIQ